MALDTHKNLDQVAYCEDQRLSKASRFRMSKRFIASKPFIICHNGIDLLPCTNATCNPFCITLISTKINRENITELTKTINIHWRR